MNKTNIFLRKDNNPDRKAMRSILREVIADSKEYERHEARIKKMVRIGAILAGFLIMALLMVKCAHASNKIVAKQTFVAGFSLDRWCEAIKLAENSKKYPYGIIQRYRHTTPLQACRNTILHYWRDYSKLPLKTRQKNAFLNYAQNRYCPIGSNTDNGTCKNWARNVGYYLEKENNIDYYNLKLIGLK